MSTLLNSRRREAIDQQGLGGLGVGVGVGQSEYLNNTIQHQQQQDRYHTHHGVIQHHTHHQQQQQQQSQGGSHDSYLPSLLDRGLSFNATSSGTFSSDFITQNNSHSGVNGSNSLPLIQYDHDDDPIIQRGGSGSHNSMNLNFMNGNNNSSSSNSQNGGGGGPLSPKTLSPSLHERFASKHDAIHDQQQQQQHIKYSQQQQQQQQTSYNNMHSNKDYSYGGPSDSLHSFPSRGDYLDRVHSPDHLDTHPYGAPSNGNGNINGNNNSHDSLLTIGGIGGGRAHGQSSQHSSLSSLGSGSLTLNSRDTTLNRFSGLSDNRASFNQNSPSGLSSLSANELGWIKEEIERQQARDSMTQMHMQQQGHMNGGGSNSAPGSNRGSTGVSNMDGLGSPLSLYDPNSGLLGGMANGNNPNSASALAGGSGIMDEVKLRKYKTVMCLLFGNLVAKADGSNVPVESLKVGDLLRGEDGRIVRVIENVIDEVCDEAYRISVAGAEPYTVTPDHLVTLATPKSKKLIEIEASELYNTRHRLHQYFARMSPLASQESAPVDGVLSQSTGRPAAPMAFTSFQPRGSTSRLMAARNELQRVSALLNVDMDAMSVTEVSSSASTSLHEYDSACARSVESALDGPAEVIIAVGPAACARWKRADELNTNIMRMGDYTSPTHAHAKYTEWVYRGRLRTVFYAPRFEHWAEYGTLLDVLAAAHETIDPKASVVVPADWALRLRVVAPFVSIERMSQAGGFRLARMNVLAVDRSWTDSDHRFVLASSILQHNCQRMVRTGGCRYGALCFGDDSRVLTDRGFLFQDEIEQLVDADGRGLSYACYDIQKQAIVYMPGVYRKFANPAGKLLSFTSKDAERQWSTSDGAEEGDADSNQLSLRVTPDHRMYLQWGSKTKNDMIDWRAVEPEKALAALLPRPACGCKQDGTDGCDQCRAHIRFTAAAVNGVQHGESGLPTLDAELSAQLGCAVEHVDTALELFGFWLADTRFRQSLSCQQHPTVDTEWLQAAIATVTGAEAAPTLTMPSWFARFDHVYVSSSSSSAATVAGAAALSSGQSSELGAAAALPFVGQEEGKWLPSWVLRRLDKRQIRLVIEGLRRADGKSTQNQNVIHTSSAELRDEIVLACLHAGYTAHFRTECKKGAVRGYQLKAGSDGTLFRHDDIVGREDEFQPITATADAWAVCYDDPMTDKGETASAVAYPKLQQQLIREESYAKDVWCVSVDHPDHLIWAQRAMRDEVGVVTKASRPIIVGNCDFAHDRHELRRNLDLHWYFAVKCEKRNCIDPECRYSHNDHEVMYHPRIYKTRLCTNYVKPGGCNRKMYCSFAHGKFELRLHTNTNLMMGGPNNIFGLVPPQPGVGPQAQQQSQSQSMPGGTTLTIQGGSQVLPRELVASLQANGISIASPNDQHLQSQSQPSPQPVPQYNPHRGSTGLAGLGPLPLLTPVPSGNAALNKKFSQGQQQVYGAGMTVNSNTPVGQYSSLSPRPSPPPGQDLGKDNFNLHDVRDGTSSPSQLPELSPQYASLGLGSAASAAAAAASAEEQADRENFRDATDQLKIRILDLVDEVAVSHYQRAFDDQAIAMANGSTFRGLSNSLHQANTNLTEAKTALSIFSGEEAAMASLTNGALDSLAATLQGVLAAVAQAKAKLDPNSPTAQQATPATCLTCQTEPVSTVVWPCAHRVLCAACKPDVCPSCSVGISRTLPILSELPNVSAILTAAAVTAGPTAPNPLERKLSGSSAESATSHSEKKTPSPTNATTSINASVLTANSQTPNPQ